MKKNLDITKPRYSKGIYQSVLDLRYIEFPVKSRRLLFLFFKEHFMQKGLTGNLSLLNVHKDDKNVNKCFTLARAFIENGSRVDAV